MDIRVKELILIDWKKLHELQPENFKIPYHSEKVKQSILKYGFSVPFAVWYNEGEYYAIDGHLRKDLMYDLINDGVNVPSKLPAYRIDCNDEKEAIEMLLEIYNTKANPINSDVFNDWKLDLDFELDITESDLHIDRIIVDGEPQEIEINEDFEPALELGIEKEYLVIVFENKEQHESAIQKFGLKKQREVNNKKPELNNVGIQRVITYENLCTVI